MANAQSTFGPGTGYIIDQNGQVAPDPNSPAGGSGMAGMPAAGQTTGGANGLAPRFAASLPQYLRPDVFGYANAWDQLLDAHHMAQNYATGPAWMNGAGRYAYAGNNPYSSFAGGNAPWDVGGYPARGQLPAGLLSQATAGLPTNSGIPGGAGGLLNSPPQKSAPAGQPSATTVAQILADPLLGGSGPNAQARAQRLAQTFAEHPDDPRNPAGRQQFMNTWNSLPNDAARYAFTLGPGGAQRGQLLRQLGLTSPQQVNQMDLNYGGYAGWDPATNRGWQSQDGQTRAWITGPGSQPAYNPYGTKIF